MADPTADQLFQSAFSLQQSGSVEKAEAAYLHLLSRYPEHRSSWTNLAVIQKDKRQLESAVAAQLRALTARPSVGSQNDLTMADHFSAGNWTSALSLVESRRQDIETASENLASLLAETGRYDEALPLQQALVDHRPTISRMASVCATLRAMGRHEQALAVLDRCAPPLVPALRMERAWARLTLGDWRGFEDFEHRFETDFATEPSLPLPRLTRFPKANDQLCVISDQGLGDAIWALRFLPALKASGARVTLALPPGLVRLFETTEHADAVVSIKSLRDRFHAAVYTSSLPFLTGFGSNPPPPIPLHIPKDSRARAKALTQRRNGYTKVGICWTGNPDFPANHKRSVPPQAFAPLATLPRTQLFSLEKDSVAQALFASGMQGLVLDVCSDDRDLADTAALIEEMDYVVSIDTSVLHLAASLRTPTIAALSYEGFWYWGPAQSSSWYPDLTIVRQPRPGDWRTVFERIAHLLLKDLSAT